MGSVGYKYLYVLRRTRRHLRGSSPVGISFWVRSQVAWGCSCGSACTCALNTRCLFLVVCEVLCYMRMAISIRRSSGE